MVVIRKCLTTRERMMNIYSLQTIQRLFFSRKIFYSFNHKTSSTILVTNKATINLPSLTNSSESVVDIETQLLLANHSTSHGITSNDTQVRQDVRWSSSVDPSDFMSQAGALMMASPQLEERERHKLNTNSWVGRKIIKKIIKCACINILCSTK